MPRLSPDMTDVSANIKIYDKGDYEIAVKSVFGFANDGTNGFNYGVAVQHVIVGKYDSKGNLDKSDEGNQVENVRLFVHTKDAMRMSKRYLMAAFGFNKKEEDEFNEWYKSQDWHVDAEKDDNDRYVIDSIGDGWKKLVDHHVKVRLDKTIYEPVDRDTGEKTGEQIEQQKFGTWSPVSVESKL